MQNDNVLTAEHREQLELIERCQPDLLLMYIRENTAFDVALLERVFELAKERARALLATPKPEPRAEVTDDDKADAARWRHFYSGHYIICKVYADGAVKNLGGGYVAKYAIDAARTGASS